MFAHPLFPVLSHWDLLKRRLGKTKHMNKFMLHSAKRQLGALVFFKCEWVKENIGNNIIYMLGRCGRHTAQAKEKYRKTQPARTNNCAVQQKSTVVTSKALTLRNMQCKHASKQQKRKPPLILSPLPWTASTPPLSPSVYVKHKPTSRHAGHAKIPYTKFV